MKPEPTWKFMDRHFNEVPDTHAEVVSITVYNEEGNPANHTLWIDKNLDLSSEKVEKSIDFFHKSKVYVKDPSDVPIGYRLVIGPKGGKFYETGKDKLYAWDERTNSYTYSAWKKNREMLLAVADLQDIRDALLPEPLYYESGEEYSYEGTLDSEFERAAKDKSNGKPAQYHHLRNIGERLIDKGVTGDKAIQWWTMHMEGWVIKTKEEGGAIMNAIAKYFMTPEGEVKEFAEGKSYVSPGIGIVDHHRTEMDAGTKPITREDYDGFMAQYEYTQDELKDLIQADKTRRELERQPWKRDSAHLYRGVGGESFEKWVEEGKPADFPFKSASISSWTSNKKQAERFAEQYGPDNKGLVLETWVPRKKIFASHRTNHKLLKFWDEQEYIILGSEKDEANVKTYWEDGNHKIRDLRSVGKDVLKYAGWSKHKIDELYSGERPKKPWERVVALQTTSDSTIITEIEWPPGSGDIIGIEELSDKEFDEWMDSYYLSSEKEVQWAARIEREKEGK